MCRSLSSARTGVGFVVLPSEGNLSLRFAWRWQGLGWGARLRAGAWPCAALRRHPVLASGMSEKRGPLEAGDKLEAILTWLLT